MRDGRRRLAQLMAVGTAVIGLLVPAMAPALGQEEGESAATRDATDYLGPEDVVAVHCHPDVVTDNQPVTCVVELTPDSPHLPDPVDDGPAMVAADTGGEARSEECYRDGASRLVCTGLRLFEPGNRSLSFRPSGAAAAVDGVAEVRVVADATEEFHASLPTAGQGALLAGGDPLTFDILEGAGFSDLDPAWGVYATVRPFDEPESAGTDAVLKEPDSDRSPALSLDAAPGLYLVSLCVGRDAATCRPLTGAFPVRVYGGTVTPLEAGTAINGADRINLILAASGLGTQARQVIGDLLMVDGLPRGLDAAGEVVAIDGRQGPVADIRFGMFAMDPFRESAHRFNLWLYEAPVYQPFEAFFRAVRNPDTGAVDAFGLPDAAVMVVADEVGRRRGERSEADDPGWIASPDVPRREDIVFATGWTWVDTTAPAVAAAHTLSHELGHALFNLRDEYVDPGREVRFGYPNCAPDEATAQSWWGDLVDTLDPFYDEWVSVLADNGAPPPTVDAAAVTVGFHPGGCYGTGDIAVRPTVDSLMNSEIPVLGAVNRRYVESVLQLYTGIKVVESTDIRDAVVEFGCSGGEQGSLVRCEGVLRPGYDATAGLDLRLEEGSSGTCTVAGDPVAGQMLSCSAPPSGSDEQLVLLSVAGEERFVPTRFAWQPPPPRVAIRSLSDDLATANVEIEDFAGRTVLDVQLTVNGAVAWIRTLDGSSSEVVTGVAGGDSVCVSVRGHPDSGNCVTAPAPAPVDTSAPPAEVEAAPPPETNGGGIPVAVVVAIVVVALAGAIVGIRAWWYRY